MRMPSGSHRDRKGLLPVRSVVNISSLVGAEDRMAEKVLLGCIIEGLECWSHVVD